MIAFSFGAFLEGAAGFGAPVAITAAMLMGLGFNPLYAAGICLIANTAPVAFGAIGIPIIVGAQVAGVDQMALSQMVGRTLPFLSVIIPLYLVVLMSGWKKGVEVWPACFVSGGSFAIVQYLSSNFLGPLLPDILASITSILCLTFFLRFWHPKETGLSTMKRQPAAEGNSDVQAGRSSGRGRLFLSFLSLWLPGASSPSRQPSIFTASPNSRYPDFTIWSSGVGSRCPQYTYSTFLAQRGPLSCLSDYSRYL